MVKLRDARYCNLKLLLLFLVIYGHLIEPEISRSQPLMSQYRWIYLFHMPMFAFLSGLFLRDREDCANQIKKQLPVYALLQAAAVLFGNGAVVPLTPWWYLWYLLSCCTWTGAGWLWLRFGKGKGRMPVLVGSVLLGCAAGFVPMVGRGLSLSRTLVFFPYFWAGLICRPDYPWERLRPVGLGAPGIVAAVMLSWGREIPVDFLYQAEPYGSVENGFALRLVCYLLGSLLCLFLLSCIPNIRVPFTKAGADTMPAYLIHGPVVLCLRDAGIGWQFYLLIAGAYLYVVCRISQWHSKVYGIVPSERRGSRWRLFRKYTKNTRSRSTGSCWLLRGTRI